MLLCLALIAWRALRLCGPAPDEIRSLLLARQRPAEMVVNAPLVDQFPAGYPLALSHWERLGRAFGIPEGLPWSRLSGLAAWALMIAAAGLLGRTIAGPGAGAALAVAWAVCGQGAFAARRLDGAALAGPALALALLCLLALYQLERLKRIGFLKAFFLWSVYALTGAVAAGCHRLAGPAVVGLGVLWLGLCLRLRLRKNGRDQTGKQGWRGFFEGGIWAHLFIFAVVFPLFWLTPFDERAMSRAIAPAGSAMERLRLILTGLSSGQQTYTTAAQPWAGWLAASAIAAALVPAVFLLCRLCFYRGWALGARERGARLLAMGGLFVAIFSIVLTRLLRLTHWGAFYAWPADGFPTWPAWALGLTGLALWSSAGFQPATKGRQNACATFPGWRSWLALTPLLFTGLAGQIMDFRHELRKSASDRALAAELPPIPLHALPAPLIPYFGGAIGGLGLGSSSNLPASGGALLVRLNPWRLLDAPEDTLLWAQAESGRRSGAVSKTALPIGPGLEFLTLNGLKPAPQAEPAAPTSGTLKEVLARDLWPGDGWDALEAGPQGDAWRWSRREDVRFRLPGLLPEGDYVVHIKGMRLAAPKGPVKWTLRFHWDWPVYTVEVPEGWFEIAVPVRLSHIYRRCYLELHHPTAPASEANPGSVDPRKVGFLFLRLWVTKN